jgi:hypothetical protein
VIGRFDDAFTYTHLLTARATPSPEMRYFAPKIA